MLNVRTDFYLYKCAITLELLDLVFFASLYVRLLHMSAGNLVSAFQIRLEASFAN